MAIFKLIVNGDAEHELSRGFGWQGEAATWLSILRANEYVSTVDLVDTLHGNTRDGEPIVRERRVYTRDGAARVERQRQLDAQGFDCAELN